MNQDYIKEQQYLNAKKRIKKIKGFYSHLIIYIIANIVISGVYIYAESHDNINVFFIPMGSLEVYSIWILWGIGVLFHWLGVFKGNNIFKKSWEERKIREIMNEGNHTKYQ